MVENEKTETVDTILINSAIILQFLQGRPMGAKNGPQTHDHSHGRAITLSNLNRFKKFFFTGRFLGKFAVKWILIIPSYFACVATLPCETLISVKRAINDKLQGSVATYLRLGGVVNNQIKIGLLLSL